jgi:transcriptional regulator with XRE-family HTH domain
MNLREYIALKLFDLRTELGLTQQAVAAQVGLVHQAISHYETGQREPSISTLKSILDAYGVSIPEFFGNWKEQA